MKAKLTRLLRYCFNSPRVELGRQLAGDHDESLLGIVVDLRRRRRGPSGIKPLVPSLGGDSVFHVEAERRRASGRRTDAGVSNPRDTWWGAVANAVPDGSPRRCNAFRRLRSILQRVLSHVTVPSKTRIETLRVSSTIRETIQAEIFRGKRSRIKKKEKKKKQFFCRLRYSESYEDRLWQDKMKGLLSSRS